MKGDDQVRFCSLCNLNVYNISAMAEEEAMALIRDREGRLCVRLYQRKDGTVITNNCPTGLAAMRRRLSYAVCLVLVFMFGGFSMAMGNLRAQSSPQESLVDRARSWPVIGPIVDKLAPQPTEIVGKLVAPMPASTAVSTSGSAGGTSVP